MSQQFTYSVDKILAVMELRHPVRTEFIEEVKVYLIIYHHSFTLKDTCKKLSIELTAVLMVC